MTAAKTVDKSLLLAFQKEMMKKEIFDKREREQQIDEIANRVLSRIHLTLDTSDAKKGISRTKKRNRKFNQIKMKGAYKCLTIPSLIRG